MASYRPAHAFGRRRPGDRRSRQYRPLELFVTITRRYLAQRPWQWWLWRVESSSQRGQEFLSHRAAAAALARRTGPASIVRAPR